MNEQAFAELVDRARAEVEPTPAPVGDILRAAHERRRRRRGGLAALGVAAIVAAGFATATLVTTTDTGQQQPTSPADSGPIASSSPPSEPQAHTQGTGAPVSTPPRPDRVTMQTVRQIALAQEFRAYSGSEPPPFSEADALRRARSADDYSLGLWDASEWSDSLRRASP
jgi:hypothetical protein